MELDARLMLTLGGMLASVISAFVIVRTKLSATIEQLTDIEQRLRALDKRVDLSELTAQRVDVLSGMLSPTEREKAARELATVVSEMSNLKKDVHALASMHNGKHPTISG